MATYTWVRGSGDWATSMKWKPAGVPGVNDNAVIAATGANYSVAIDSTDAANSLVVSSAYAEVNDTGSLAIGTTFAMSAGEFNLDTGGSLSVGTTFTLSGGVFALNYGGTLTAATTIVSGGMLELYGGTLGGGTIDVSALDLSEIGTSVQISPGEIVKNAAGNGAGTVNDTGDDSTLYFDGTQTFDNATINLGSAVHNDYYSLLGASYLESDDVAGTGTVLTLGPNVTVNTALSGFILDSGGADDGIVNQGTINQTEVGSVLGINVTESVYDDETFFDSNGNAFTNAGAFNESGSDDKVYIYGNIFTNSGVISETGNDAILEADRNTFTNSGTINVGSGTTFVADSNTFTNTASGKIAIDADATFDLTPTGSWSNLGSITLASGSSLYLGGNFTLADLGSVINSGGSIYFQGILDNTGNTLNGSGPFGSLTLDDGTIEGGTVTSSGFSGSGTLDDVIEEGALNVRSGGLTLSNGTTVTGADGIGPGSINVGKAELYIDDTQTFDNATIGLGGGELYGTATFGSKVKINEAGPSTIGGEFVSQGVISQTGSRSQLTIDGDFANSGTIKTNAIIGGITISTETFTNTGVISAAKGDTVTIEAYYEYDFYEIEPGTSTFGGTISGTGALAITEGFTSIASGAKISIANWAISSAYLSATDIVTLGESLTYAGAFTLGTGVSNGSPVLTLTGGNLTLTGGASFAGATVNGSMALNASGQSSVSALTIGGTAAFHDGGTVTQSGGNVTLGDSSGATASLYTGAAGVWNITDNSGIALGASTASAIHNADLFEKTLGAGTSVIAPSIVNTGNISATSGTLDLQGALSGTGKVNVGDGATLEADGAVAAGQTLLYTASTTGELALNDVDVGGSQLFAGSISGFATGDTLDVGAPFGMGTTAVYHELAGGKSGMLTLSDGSLKATINFLGNYGTDDFMPVYDGAGGTKFTFS